VRDLAVLVEVDHVFTDVHEDDLVVLVVLFGLDGPDGELDRIHSRVEGRRQRLAALSLLYLPALLRLVELDPPGRVVDRLVDRVPVVGLGDAVDETADAFLRVLQLDLAVEIEVVP
jgi:hypothetical protein